MKEVTELIKAIATLLWPILGFVALLLFRSQISEAIGRIKKGKFLGQEIELSEDLKKLQKSASEASREVASMPSLPIEEDIDSDFEEIDLIKNIIHEANRSPKAALILLASEVEKEARQTLASIGKLKGRSGISLMQTVSELIAIMDSLNMLQVA